MGNWFSAHDFLAVAAISIAATTFQGSKKVNQNLSETVRRMRRIIRTHSKWFSRGCFHRKGINSKATTVDKTAYCQPFCKITKQYFNLPKIFRRIRRIQFLDVDLPVVRRLRTFFMALLGRHATSRSLARGSTTTSAAE